MLAYAAQSAQRRTAGRPRLLVPIAAGHLVLIAIVMSAHMDVVRHDPPPPLVVETYRVPPPPPPDPTPPPPRAATDPAPARTSIDPIVQVTPLPNFGDLLPARVSGSLGDGSGTSPLPQPQVIVPDPPHMIVRTPPKMATADSAIRPPYPAARRESGVEATLTLRLGIDDHGRVTSVDPIGTADPAFLASARAHLIRAWRFEPATEDGKPVASNKTITLRFQLGEGDS